MSEFNSGFVAIVGLPNAGKSTLLNSLLEQKVVIVSDKPQTTRNSIQGVLTNDDFQIVFIDTPGVQTPKNKLGEHMVKSVRQSLVDVDAIILMIDIKSGFRQKEAEILNIVKGKGPVVLVINKCDAVEKEKVLATIASVASVEGIDEIVPISAMKHDNLDELVKVLKQYLKPGPKYYPDDMITDQPERVIAAEMIREKALNVLRDELPHGIGVDILKIETIDEKVNILATIYCEKESHKGMIIGKNGALLKDIGTKARFDLQKLFGNKVYLELYVKVVKNWRNNNTALKDLGFE